MLGKSIWLQVVSKMSHCIVKQETNIVAEKPPPANEEPIQSNLQKLIFFTENPGNKLPSGLHVNTEVMADTLNILSLVENSFDHQEHPISNEK
ncbi:hypothetical protein AVEN_38872-1 [Araneus ventricosus]|uniref:Uncharacterized protein n=1 Tax=Araneus ventricosus TaxID=182803 RepID=A0A4Y2HRM1_ARAVE|nr:hypothetical protein AVEN_174970-1 [Araneus ventricosus]GBO25469.1 hypothetical protein AVEN_38872-1 [Araneus ventricosus]